MQDRQRPVARLECLEGLAQPDCMQRLLDLALLSLSAFQHRLETVHRDLATVLARHESQGFAASDLGDPRLGRPRLRALMPLPPRPQERLLRRLFGVGAALEHA
jgi:hypothetical protein